MDTAQVSSDTSVQVSHEEASAQPVLPDFSKTKHKVKIDDQELDVDYEELRRGYQKAASSDKRFREASTLKSQADDFLKKIDAGDFNALLEKASPDKVREFAEKYLMDYLEFQQLPEDSKKARLLEIEKQKLQKELEDERAEKTKKASDDLTAEAYKEIDTEITEALKAMGKKPTPRLIARIAEQMLAAMEVKGARLPAKDALSRTIGDVHHDIAEYLTDLPTEKLLEVLPPNVVEALRKAEVQKVLSQDPLRSGKVRQLESSKPKPSKVKQMTSDEYFKSLEKRLGG